METQKVKIKVISIILVLALILTGCEKIQPLRQNTISYKELTRNEQETVSLISPTSTYAIYEYTLKQFAGVKMILETYEQGNLTSSHNIASHIPNDAVIDYEGKLGFSLENDKSMRLSFISISEGGGSSYTIPPSYITVPFDSIGSMYSIMDATNLSIEADKEIVLFLNAYMDKGEDIQSIDLENFNKDILNTYKFCYIIKCVFE